MLIDPVGARMKGDVSQAYITPHCEGHHGVGWALGGDRAARFVVDHENPRGTSTEADPGEKASSVRRSDIEPFNSWMDEQ